MADNFKTYVLVDRLDNSVPIFQRVNKDQRVPVKKRKGYAPFLQIVCQDESGVSHNLRYKEGCATFELDEQVEKYKIPANAKYTPSEYRDREFKNGTLTTKKASLQKWLEMYPGFEGSPYTSDDIPMSEYMLYDKTNLNKIQNAETKKRVKAMARVLDLDLDAAQAMLIRLNGSFFVPPNDVEECQNMLVEFVDAAEDDGLTAVLKVDTELSVDEKTTILIGSLINAELLSFDKTQGQISKKDKGNKWISIREMSDTYDMEERKRLFSDFLNTDDGKALKADLEKDLAKAKK